MFYDDDAMGGAPADGGAVTDMPEEGQSGEENDGEETGGGEAM